MTARLRPWPVLKVGLGPAMTKADISARLGVSKSAPDVWLTRTRRGELRVPFPKPAGRAVPPDARREYEVPYWYERDVLKFGREFGLLDQDNQVRANRRERPTPTS